MQRNPFDQFDDAGPIYTGEDPSAQNATRGQDRQDDQFRYQQSRDEETADRDERRIGLSAEDSARDAQRLESDRGKTQFSQRDSLSNNYFSDPVVKSYTSKLPIYASALKASGPQGDQTLIMAFQALSQPTANQVTADEIAITKNNQSWLEQNDAMLRQKFGWDGGHLSDKGRRAIVVAMGNVMDADEKMYLQRRDYYSDLANQYGFSPYEVIGDHVATPFRAEFDAYDAKQKEDKRQEMVGVTTGQRMDMETTDDDNRYYFERAYGHTYDQDQAMVQWLNSNIGQPLTAEEIEAKKQEFGIKSGWSDSADLASRHKTVGTTDSRGMHNIKWGGNPLDAGRSKAIAQKDKELAATEALGMPFQRNSDAFDRGVVNGVTLNWGDEIVGLFDQNSGREMRLSNDVYDKTAGGYKLAGEVGGSLVLPMKGGGIGRAAAQGAAYGAVSGMGSGETMGQRALGGVAGGALGAGGGAIGETVSRAAAPYVAKGIDKVANFRAGRSGRLASDGAQEVVDAGQRMGVPTRPADIVPNLRDKRRDALQGPRGSDIRSAADDDLAAMQYARDTNLGGNRAPMDRNQIGDTVQSVSKRYRQAEKDKARPIYEAAEKASGDTRIFGESGFREAIRQINEVKAGGVGTNSAELKYLNTLKNDMAQRGGFTVSGARAFRSGQRQKMKNEGIQDTSAMQMRVDKIMNAFSNDIYKSLPTDKARSLYKEADTIWAKQKDYGRTIGDKLVGKNREVPKPVGEAASAFDSIVKGDPKGLARFMGGASKAERADIRASYAARLGDDGKGGFSPIKFIKDTDPRTGKIPETAMSKLFDKRGMAAIEDLRKIAQSKVDAASTTNWSNTGGPVSAGMRNARHAMLGAFGLSEAGVTGGALAAGASTLFSKWGANRSARVLLNPDVTKWLRQTPPTANPARVEAHLRKLGELVTKGSITQADGKDIDEELRKAYAPDSAKAGKE